LRSFGFSHGSKLINAIRDTKKKGLWRKEKEIGTFEK